MKKSDFLRFFQNFIFFRFFLFFIFYFFIFFFSPKEKKCYPLSFPILGGRDSTRALQSSPFQNPGGGSPESDTGGVVGVAGWYFSFLIQDYPQKWQSNLYLTVYSLILYCIAGCRYAEPKFQIILHLAVHSAILCLGNCRHP